MKINKTKIAIYQGLFFHYEMLGYLLDYFVGTKNSVDIYCPENNDGNEWKTFYESLFKIKFNFLVPTTINPDNYDLIFLVTDDDPTFKQEWLDKYGEKKVICIDHTVCIRRSPENMLRIGTRFFHLRPKCLWALPVYNYVNKFEKIKCLEQTNKINVVCMGQTKPLSGEFLQKLIVNFNSIDFHIVSRKIEPKYKNFSNIKTYENCSTAQMMNLIKYAHYMICFESPTNLDPRSNSISGSIPLAFDSGCQLIIPKSFQYYYNFKSVITYEDALLQENDSTPQLILTQQIDLDKIYSEAYELIHHKNHTFEHILETKLGNTNFKYNNNLLNVITGMFIDEKPKVAIDLTDNSQKINNLTEDFREINCFINHDLQKNNIYYHSNKEYFLSDTIFKIKESCFIFIENDSNTQKYLSKLSNRGYKDIIILENIIMNKNEIEKYLYVYKKLISFYPIENSNSIVIIPQN